MADRSTVSPNLAPSIDDQAMYAISDDECMARLAHVLEEHDDQRLREVALLISRLAVPIE